MLLLSRRQTSKPSMSGIITSSRTRSQSARSQIDKACSPLPAVTTSKYSADSRASSSFTLAGTSSTTRTRAVIDPFPVRSCRTEKVSNGLDELAHRDRLRQIGFAAALADALLVALHRESGDCDNRNCFQLLVVLQPFGHFQARHFRQLNVHQDQIRPVPACKIERLDAIARADRAIAMGFQQVVEELHIELIVLHDQDGLGHPLSLPRVPLRA